MTVIFDHCFNFTACVFLFSHRQRESLWEDNKNREKLFIIELCHQSATGLTQRDRDNHPNSLWTIHFTNCLIWFEINYSPVWRTWLSLLFVLTLFFFWGGWPMGLSHSLKRGRWRGPVVYPGRGPSSFGPGLRGWRASACWRRLGGGSRAGRGSSALGCGRGRWPLSW